jgi:hypothetical protein
MNSRASDPAVQSRYRAFIDSCRDRVSAYRLTPRAEPTAYATCFAVFGLHLIGETGALKDAAQGIALQLRSSLRSERQRMAPESKAYRQLLAFTMSALAVLGAIEEDPLEELVREQLPADVDSALRGALAGEPQSGNQAMFTAVFLLHAERYLGIDTRDALGRWLALHLARMNRFGFWGPQSGMTHLQFQNGYHQYEIFEYLGIRNPRQEHAIAAVRSLADRDGRFAPYPGGGGCYDYDAVFVLTPEGRPLDEESARVLRLTRDAILSEQTPEGGFAESHAVRPRSLRNWRRAARQVADALGNRPLFLERLRYNLTLQRPKHNRIHTHWSRYSRRWGEANLWDSWFRMLTLARIEIALDPSKASEWGFIDYPGIGFHPSVRHGARVAA